MSKWFNNNEVHRHRSYDFRRKNKFWIVILILIIFCSLIYAYDILGLKTSIKNIISTNLSVEKDLILSKNKCPSEIIPDRLLLIENNMPQSLTLMKGAIWLTNNANPSDYIIPQWKDGIEISYAYLDFNGVCHHGSSKGENINYVYCNNLGYSKSKTEISKEGVVGDTTTISYSINLILIKDKVLKEDIISSLIYYKIISSECIKQ
ncbi:MAG: hypothetical protein NT139_00010 [Candidatus Woesearchaeota archaeon]|nr:hypothetical protein [Candidatus Woesearchaeota archaeon]